MTDTRPPAEGGIVLNSHLKMDVTVYFPAHEQRCPAHEPGVIYFQAAGRWLRYEKSGDRSQTDSSEAICSSAGTGEKFNGPNGKVQGPIPEPLSFHWAGHQSGRSYELTRARRPRVYYDPKRHPDLFVANNGGPPIAPLPVLELNGDLEDPEPWLDPRGGTRHTREQARTVTAILRYAPRKKQSRSLDE